MEFPEDRQLLAQQDIEWQYNPPAASHMGGVWERMIRSVRHTLKAVLTEQCSTDDVLRTALAEVEKILNDRPLTPPSDSPDDLQPLTPSQILLLRSNSSLPPGLFSKEDSYSKRRWRQAQYLANLFWRRWVREYLPLLQARQKWTKPVRNFVKDDLVLVKADNEPRGHWPMGRIVEAYPDKHGHVRSVKVRTASGYLVRPVTCLCLLEGDIQTTSGIEAPHDPNSDMSDEHMDSDGSNCDGVQKVSADKSRPVRAASRRKPAYLKDYV